MESARSLTLIMSLVASALPVAALNAHEKTGTTTGPLARAVTREAVRLATAGEPRSSTAAVVQSFDTSARSDWTRVVAIPSDTDVVVTVQGSTSLRRRFVRADPSTLTVLSRRTQLVEVIARGNVREIRTERLSDKKRALGLLGGLGGTIGGTYVGGTRCGLGCASVGMMAGMVGGSILGYRAVTRAGGDLIYRAP